jgi:hypothetical protein
MIKGKQRIVLVASLLVLATGGALVFGQSPQTPAEKADYQQRGTLYAPMMEYIYDLDSRSDLMSVQKFAETVLGRDIVLVIMSDPPVFQPADVEKLDKPVVLIVNNVHGGEYAGKDATLALMRDLVMGELKPLLQKVIVLIVPTINPDGAEVYRRTNEQTFDLNRDYVKLESREIHGLVTRVMNTWHPDIHVDTHHGGSAPYALTFQTCLSAACDQDLVALGNNVIIPRIRQALRQENYDGFWYSGPARVNNQEGWAPTSPEPRKQHTYSGLSNIVGFLFETPSGSHRLAKNGTEVVPIEAKERYRHQVRGQYIGQRELIRFAAEETDRLHRTIRQAKQSAIALGSNPADNDQVMLEYQQVSKGNEEFWRAKGWEERRRPEGGPREIEYEKVNLPIFTKFSTTRTTTRPWGYLLPPNLATVVPLLLDHEIAVQKLTEAVEVDAEVYYATDMRRNEYFQGHYLQSVKVEKKVEKLKLPAGSFFVACGQPKANLISYLLEPETDDNLVTWNYLDNYLQIRSPELRQNPEDMPERARAGQAAGQRIPIYRLMNKAVLKGLLVDKASVIQ